MKNNKIYLIAVFSLFLLNTNLTAQIPIAINAYDIRNEKNVFDSAQYLFKYKLSFIKDTAKKDTSYNVLSLLVGQNHSKFFNDVYLNPELVNFFNKSPVGYSTSIDGSGLAATEIYKDNKQKKMTVTLMARNTPYYYKEELIPQEWNIRKEKKTLMGYSCQKATTKYLGREYTAWFTAEIPIQNGPWKFGGLPGLILQVSDKNGQYIFECISIENLTTKLPIVQYAAKYTETDRLSMNKLIKNFHTHFIQTMKATLGANEALKMRVDGYEQPIKISRTSTSDSDVVFPFNPIELE